MNSTVTGPPSSSMCRVTPRVVDCRSFVTAIVSTCLRAGTPRLGECVGTAGKSGEEEEVSPFFLAKDGAGESDRNPFEEARRSASLPAVNELLADGAGALALSPIAPYGSLAVA